MKEQWTCCKAPLYSALKSSAGPTPSHTTNKLLKVRVNERKGGWNQGRQDQAASGLLLCGPIHREHTASHPPAWFILSLTHEYSCAQGGHPRTKPLGHWGRGGVTCYHQSGRRPVSWPRERPRAGQGLLNHQAVSPAHTRWLLCVSKQWRKCPTDLAGSNFPPLSLSISSQGHLAKLPPVLLGKNW